MRSILGTSERATGRLRAMEWEKERVPSDGMNPRACNTDLECASKHPVHTKVHEVLTLCWEGEKGRKLAGRLE